MIYRDFQDIKLSALGMGAMRLPVVDGDDSRIDEKKAEEMVAYAMENGVNYYDTAWGYHGGNSELVMGKALKNYPRESFYLASKFPGYDLANMDKVEEIFEKQLEKCQVEYFDFYLFHNVCEMNIDAYLDPKYGIFEYLMKQKENGRIRHLGFSAHGRMDVLKRFLDAYGEHMEFCQLQLNYLDWTFQNAEEKVELMREHNIPVWVMEPVRGGKLASLDPENESKLKALRPEESIAAWAFRFLQSVPEVKVVLSGMSNMEQMQEILNICEVKPAILQTEVHPYSQEPELKKFLEKEGMVIQAWYPLGHGDKALIQEPLFVKLGEKYKKTSAQIILRWHIQDGNIVIPGSKNPDHIRDNFDLFDFELTGKEMESIAGMDIGHSEIIDHHCFSTARQLNSGKIHA